MNPNIVRTAAENSRRAQIFKGTTVQTTGGRFGVVEEAVPKRGGVIELHARDVSTQEKFVTDSEHATISN